MNISLTFVHVVAACVAFCGVVVGNSNGVSLYRWVVYRETIRVNPENKKIVMVIIEWVYFLFGYAFLIYSFYGIEEQVRPYFFPPTAMCMYDSSSDTVEKSGIKILVKFVERCKEVGGPYEFRAEERLDKIKKDQYENSLDCLQHDGAYVMDCIYTYMTNFPYEKDSINKYFDTAKTCIFNMKCLFDDDKKALDFVFNRPQCGFGIRDVKYITEKIGKDVKISLDVYRGKVAVEKSSDIKFCSRLIQLPAMIPSENQYKTYERKDVAAGLHKEDMKPGRVDENTILAIEFYNVIVRNYFD